MDLLKKVINFVAHPTHSRTMGILVAFVLLAAISLTVIVSQQQQTLRQRASELECEKNFEADKVACFKRGDEWRENFCTPGFPFECEEGVNSITNSCFDNANTARLKCLSNLPPATTAPTTRTPECKNVVPDSCDVLVGNAQCAPEKTECLSGNSNQPILCCKFPGANTPPTPTATSAPAAKFDCSSLKNDENGKDRYYTCRPGDSPPGVLSGIELSKNGFELRGGHGKNTICETQGSSKDSLLCWQTKIPTSGLTSFAGSSCDTVGSSICNANTPYDCTESQIQIDGQKKKVWTSRGASCRDTNQVCVTTNGKAECQPGSDATGPQPPPNSLACSDSETVGGITTTYSCESSLGCPAGKTPHTGRNCSAGKICCSKSVTAPTTLPPAVSTPTPNPGAPGASDVLIDLAVKINGLSVAGKNPRTIIRPVTVVVQGINDPITKTGNVEFSSSDGLFKTDTNLHINLGSKVPVNTPVNLVIKSDFFKGRLAGVTLKPGINSLSNPTLQVGIGDDGLSIDTASYYGALTDCYGNKVCSNKKAADVNDDGKVDGLDFNFFARSIAVIIGILEPNALTNAASAPISTPTPTVAPTPTPTPQP